jgi:hypothetical protein
MTRGDRDGRPSARRSGRQHCKHLIFAWFYGQIERFAIPYLRTGDNASRLVHDLDFAANLFPTRPGGTSGDKDVTVDTGSGCRGWRL